MATQISYHLCVARYSRASRFRPASRPSRASLAISFQRSALSIPRLARPARPARLALLALLARLAGAPPLALPAVSEARSYSFITHRAKNEFGFRVQWD